jgi:hypothetical protein
MVETESDWLQLVFKACLEAVVVGVGNKRQWGCQGDVVIGYLFIGCAPRALAQFLLAKPVSRRTCIMPGEHTRETSTASTTLTPTNLPHADAGSTILTVLWVLTTIPALFLALRLYCKFKTHRGLWWDDHILLGSWVGQPAKAK